ncbi:hypothetical protein EAE96_007126 [Botrytis aclada]|nr:hypothetical protein EAE96_007126 [Botrytis aclada]
MSDSNISTHNEEQKASQTIESTKDCSSDVSNNAAQNSPLTPQSDQIKKEKSEKDQLEKDIAHHRSALYYGPPDLDARFWGIIATSRRNRSVNRVNKEIRKPNMLSNVGSGEEFGKASAGAKLFHLPEPDIQLIVDVGKFYLPAVRNFL